MFGYGRCPRCGGLAMEHLQTHSHCWDCNYFPDEGHEINLWQQLEFRIYSVSASRRMHDDLILAGRNSTDEQTGEVMC